MGMANLEKKDFRKKKRTFLHEPEQHVSGQAKKFLAPKTLKTQMVVFVYVSSPIQTRFHLKRSVRWAGSPWRALYGVIRPGTWKNPRNKFQKTLLTYQGVYLVTCNCCNWFVTGL